MKVLLVALAMLAGLSGPAAAGCFIFCFDRPHARHHHHVRRHHAPHGRVVVHKKTVIIVKKVIVPAAKPEAAAIDRTPIAPLK